MRFRFVGQASFLKALVNSWLHARQFKNRVPEPADQMCGRFRAALSSAHINDGALLDVIGMPHPSGLTDESFLPFWMELVQPARKRHAHRVSRSLDRRSQTRAMAQVMIGSGFLLFG
jgi:hypothetical protein